MTGILFGLGLRASAADPAAEARAAERLGFDFVSLADHPCGASPTNEAWTALCLIAAATSRIRVAPRVLGVPYRPPAMVAKMAETLSRLSGGRLILGLGGGYSDEEFRAFGLGVPSARQKVDGLEEAVAVIKGLWSQPRFTFAGGVYHTAAADLEPKPARPIPVWLGTVDERARAADSVVSGPPAAVAEQLAGFFRLGFTALSLTPAGPEPAEQAERLAREVMPAVTAAVS